MECADPLGDAFAQPRLPVQGFGQMQYPARTHRGAMLLKSNLAKLGAIVPNEFVKPFFGHHERLSRGKPLV